MFKRALQVAATLGVLLAGYAGYVRGFAALTARLARPQVVRKGEPSPVALSETAKEANRLAARAFGPGHWAAQPKDLLRVYSKESGYWMYFKTYARSADGKRLTFAPFALVWTARKDGSLKTLRGEQATVDFDRPFDLGQPGADEANVVLARISGDVHLRDDKGDLDPLNDLTIGPLTHLDFDGRANQIRSGSAVVLRDRDLTATGVGLVIDLLAREGASRPGAGPSGYTGARSIRMLSHVHIRVADVGRTGIVPGAADAPPAARGKPRPPRPGDVQCDGAMRIDLPPPRRRVLVGPPAPKGATRVHFERNVVVRQAAPAPIDPDDPEPLPDQCNADNLDLTLLPSSELPVDPLEPAHPRPQPAPRAAVAAADQDDPGALTGLTLVKAEATGHAVWLQSPSQGTQAGPGGNLTYERQAPGQPTMIYFSGKAPIDVEKVSFVAEGPRAGQVQEIDKLRAMDVTIYQRRRAPATIIARGPGWIETRSSRDGPVERSAAWRDKLVVQSYTQDKQERRRIVLTGDAAVSSPTQGTLQARKSIVAYLKPQAKDPKAKAKAAPATTGDAFRIEKMEAVEDVRLLASGAAPAAGADPTAPASRKTIQARHRLDVEFLDPPPAPPAPPKPVLAAAPTPVANPLDEAEPPRPAPAKPPEPNLDVKADTVWAQVMPVVGTSNRAEIREVRLRGDVAIHQDPAPGKKRGTDVTARAVDLYGQGQGRALLRAHGNDAQAARVVTDELTIEGVVLNLDQAKDHAWVDGPGRLKQEAGGTVLVDAKPEPAKTQDQTQPKTASGPLEITWRESMNFLGRPIDDQGRIGPARAEFKGQVHAANPTSSLACARMIAGFDRPFAFTRPPRDPKAPPLPPEAKPQIVTVRCLQGVEIINRAFYPNSTVLREKQRVLGEDVTYHRPAGEFLIKGAGEVHHFGRDQEASSGLPRVTTVSATTRARPAADAQPKPTGPPAKLGPLVLTLIRFEEKMRGHFAASELPGAAAPRQGPREADFDGAVRVLRAKVAGEDVVLDPDDPPADFVSLYSRTLHLASEPAPAGKPATTFLDADGDAFANTYDRVIRGDRIKYNSLNEKILIEGGTQGVIIGQQSGQGQPVSYGRGQSVLYNLKTKRSEVVNPKDFQFLDPGSGQRAVPLDPEPESKEKKKPRQLVRPPQRSDKERRGFSGR